MKTIEAAGGVVFRCCSSIPEVLLIYRLGVWDLPKGKLEENEAIEACAIREVTEEIGTKSSPKIITRLLDTQHQYERDSLHFAKTTHWFLMKFKNPAELKFQPEREEGIEKVEWVSLANAKNRVGYENLITVLESFEKYISEK